MTQVATPRRTNRRLSARLACQLTVRYRLNKEWHPSTAMDLSRAGCRLRLGEDLPRGSRVQVAFGTPVDSEGKSIRVELPGTVIWCRIEGLSHQAGIQFDGEREELQELLSTSG